QKSDILVKQIVQDYIYTWILSRHSLFLQIKLNLSVTVVTRHVKLKMGYHNPSYEKSIYLPCTDRFFFDPQITPVK
ncbi:MAG: hypothetical protein L6247_05820, partial [Desulfobacteraceae bacterium]|nr:hypothetical protein [Pseudomonadota bacterium]MCG2755065.1 hypothetical protein [Desulfobacteraceae bacterium]